MQDTENPKVKSERLILLLQEAREIALFFQNDASTEGDAKKWCGTAFRIAVISKDVERWQ